ncbi:MAG: alpha/beta hydrolase [Beutenbergiaceae bacterium]
MAPATSTSGPPSYDTCPSWLRYRALLKQRFGIDLDTEPEQSWRSIAGHQVHLDDWAASGTPVGTVIMVHGAGGNGRILAPFAARVARLGWRVLAPDLPGYGLTRPAPNFDWDYRHWPAVVAELADACTGPVVLLGASVGGMTAVLAAQASSQVAGVVATTLLDMSEPAIFTRAARTPALGRVSLWAFANMPWLVDRVRVPLRWVAPLQDMSSDGALGQYFRTDPLLGRSRVSLRLFRTMHRTAVDVDPGCAVLLAHPGADAWTPTELSARFLRSLPGQTTMRELSNGSHLPLEQPALTELTDEVSAFLQAIVG